MSKQTEIEQILTEANFTFRTLEGKQFSRVMHATEYGVHAAVAARKRLIPIAEKYGYKIDMDGGHDGSFWLTPNI